MCAGAIYWANIGRVVYGMTERRLLELTGSNEQNPTFDLPCRNVFACGQKEIEDVGPFSMDKVMKLFPQVVVGTSIAIGVGSLYASEVYANLPEAISTVLSNGLFMVTLSAVVLNLLLNGKKALSVDE